MRPGFENKTLLQKERDLAAVLKRKDTLKLGQSTYVSSRVINGNQLQNIAKFNSAKNSPLQLSPSNSYQELQ